MKDLARIDVLILGGGAAGIAAAVGAAKPGLSVLLIDRNPFLGGLATTAEVGTVCGLYHFSKKGSTDYVAGRFACAFAEMLKAKSGTAPEYNNYGLQYLPYRIEAFKQVCADLLEKHHIQYLLGAELFGITRSGSGLESVSVNTDGAYVRIPVGSIVDCSGDGLLSQLADLPMIESARYQAAAQVFSLQNVNETSETRLGMILLKAVRTAIKDKLVPDYFDRVYLVPGSLRDRSVSLKLGIPMDVTGGPENLAALNTAAGAFVHDLTKFLINQVPAFETATLSHVAPQVGIRVGLRTVGKYILTEEDVLGCRKFDDAIARAAWPIEEWEQDRRVKMRYTKEMDFYQIPARCLQSSRIDNLFTAGKCISATDSAIASARVMGICLQTGYAAGHLAAARVLNLTLDDGIKHLQEQQFE